jgi:hypothetical protein
MTVCRIRVLELYSLVFQRKIVPLFLPIATFYNVMLLRLVGHSVVKREERL